MSRSGEAPPAGPDPDGPPSTWRPAPASHRTADLGPPATPRGELAAGATFGRFRIERLLGQGGMGRVYEATDSSLERPVALKVLREGGGDAATRLLLHEARAVAALRHESVVSIYEAGECEGTPYIAMELLEGATLRRHIGAEGAPPEQRLAWALDVARALAAAHAAGLVHRDVKPENVFVCEGGRAKLLDFGIAARESAPPSARHEGPRAPGTPRYMPPEQLSGRAPDARSDQYAWALTTYELLCGTLEGATAPGAASRLRASAPQLSERAAAALERCLRPEPAARFASMGDVTAELTASPQAPLGAHFTDFTPSTPEPSPKRPWRAILSARWAITLATLASLGVLGALLPLRGPARRLAPPCSPDGPEPQNLGGPTPDALMAVSHDADLLLYGTFGDTSAAPSGIARARVQGERGEVAFEPFEPFMQVVPPEGRRITAASWRGEDVLAVYSDALGSFGVWGPLTPISALRLDHASLGLATATAGDALFGVSLGAPKGRAGREIVAFSMRLDAGPKRDVVYQSGPNQPLSPAAIAAAGGRALVAFAAGDRVLAVALDEHARRDGEALELARGAIGPPAVAAAGASSFIVAWPERRDGTSSPELRAAALPLDGRPAGPAHALGAFDAISPALALASDKAGAVAAWAAPDGHIVVRALSADASPATEPLALRAAGGVRSLVAATRPGGAWIAWVEGGPPARARVNVLRCGAAP